jgi:hypothetical protein
MRQSRSCLELCGLAGGMVLAVTIVRGADIAIVDFADQWTGVDALRQTLDEFGYEYDDLTADLELGELPLDDQKLFFIGSMTTNNPTLHQNLDQNAEVIQAFVEAGGIVIEPTQADQNEALVDWLPLELICVRSDPDSPDFTISDPDHPLFHEPNEMTDADFLGWGHQGWPTVWEVIASQRGFEVLAESLTRPVIMEAEYGAGKFVMMSLAPDKFHIAGNDDFTKEMAGLFMENLLEVYGKGGDTTPPAPSFRRGDADADGTVNITDGVFALTYLFSGGAAPTCVKTADSDDSGGLDISDAVFLLQFLFSGGAMPPAPFGECGTDGTPDELTCEAYAPCG